MLLMYIFAIYVIKLTSQTTTHLFTLCVGLAMC